MKISIFTDASLEHTYGVGGFAFYIGCQVGKIQKAGSLKDVLAKNNGVNIAELK